MNTTTYTKEEPIPHKISEKQKQNIILASVALFPLVISIIVFALVVLIGNIQFPDKIGPKGELAEIIIPVDKSTIPKKFSISGTIENMPKDTFVYLIENRDNHFWPTLSIGNKATTWKKQLKAHGKKGKFYFFMLITVDKKGKKELDLWFKTSRETGKYPGLKNIDFTTTIAKVRVKT